MKVHELAKVLNRSSKEILEKLKTLGVSGVLNHMSNLDNATVARIKAKFSRPVAKKAAKPKPAAAVVKTPKVEKEKPKVAPKPKEAPKEAPTKSKTESPKVEKPAGVVPPEPPKVKSAKLESKPVEAKSAPVPAPAATVVAEPIRLDLPITVGALSAKLNVRVSELIKTLMSFGVFANVNQLLSEEVVFKAAAQLGIAVERVSDEAEEKSARLGKRGRAEEPGDKLRSPVVTLMGHVDHGKTSLLDAIRKTNVAGKEAGQITQHIGAYGVDLPGKGHVTFLDTPGHEAFTAMRARGVNVTDVVVLVVAADDGVMPQTIEAMDHARDAGVPIVVAVNKCDLPQANPQKVMLQLQKIGLVSEEWGGKTIFCEVSAKTGEGIDHLLEMLLLESEVLELKANPDRSAQGTVVEGRLTKGSGPVATVIVQQGTLRVGNILIAGSFYGRVRALRNDRGKPVQEAGPSRAVEVHGLSGVPNAGDVFQMVEDEKKARQITENRAFEIRERKRMGLSKHLSLETLHEKIQTGAVKELKLIIKGDVQGSVEALAQSLEKLSTEAVRLHVIHGGAGGVNESDVMLAAASDAVILGFHVKADPRAQQLSEEEGVDTRFYNIIYEAVEDVRKAMEGLLEPSYREVIEGRAEVRQVFRSSKSGTVGGGTVSKGKITRSSKIRLVRNQAVVFEGKLSSLRRFKDDVREVLEGFEFGFVLEGSANIQPGDALEACRMEKGPAPKLK